ncbi:hypothetical protein RB195_016161 [Necator americanus]|uniref:UDP-N-acetylglucosamine transferase subunit ALG14 n=1 Tax=Necator americanus TaxID=51031 RepID=A0ABR1E889_NECAM
MQTSTSAPCSICGKGPFLIQNLYKHLRNVHKCSEDQVEEVKSAVKRAVYAEEIKCDTCGRVFFSAYGMRKHKKNVHGDNAASTSAASEANSGINRPIKCPGCDQSHNGLLGSFEEWLGRQETETCSKLIKRGHNTRSSKGHTYTYTCQHAGGDGKGVDPQEVKQRYKKMKQVHKHCPCFAKVHVRGDGLVEITACFGHLGHDINSASFPLSNEDELTIKSMIVEGVPPQTIVAKLRATKWRANEDPRRQPRICYITMRDVTNIAARHGLVDGRRSEDDLTSLKCLLKDENEIAAVKLIETDDPTGDGFALALVTTNGRKYLERYGHRGIVFDDTFNVTRYAFRLATLLVSDDGGNGFPCAFLLSYRMTAAEIRVLFELVKGCEIGLNPQYVMTDDTYVFYNAFKAVFPSSQAAKVLCSFHISQALQRKHKELLKHVEKNYSGRRREWAPCYRPNAPFTTSNHAESWHNTLKHTILRGKQNSRMDTVVHLLLSHSRNRQLQLISACVRGGSDMSWRRKQNTRRHKDALSSYSSTTAAISKETSNSWRVVSRSRKGVSYEVTINESSCDCSENVNSHCERCGVCGYQVQCTCPDGYQSGVSCIHAHAVATFDEDAARMLRPVRRRLDDCSTPLPSCSKSSSGDSGRTFNLAPDDDTVDEVTSIEDIVTQDSLKEALQTNQGVLALLSEKVRELCRTKQVKLVDRINEGLRSILQDITKEMVEGAHPSRRIRKEREVSAKQDVENKENTVAKEVIGCAPFARRTVLQTTGAGPKPLRIQPQYKSRSTIKAEKKRKTKFIDDESDLEEQTRSILGTDRRLLQTCFVCGRRNPEENDENEVFWVVFEQFGASIFNFVRKNPLRTIATDRERCSHEARHCRVSGAALPMIYVFFFTIVSLILWGVFLTTGYLCYLVRHSNHGQTKYKVNPRTEPVSLCCVMGSGGHTMEMLELLKNLGKQYTPRWYIIADTDHISADKVKEFESSREDGAFNICTIPRSREVGQSFITAVPTTLYSFLFALRIVWNASPDLLLVNGPGSCIPVVFAAALFDMVRLRDTVIIYEESLCRVETLSLSGSILYFLGLADDIIVQWKQLKEKYPRTTLISDLQ